MIKRFLLLILSCFTGNMLFSQVPFEFGGQGNLPFLLKTDARAILLQPGVSMEYFLNKKLSHEVGVSYFRTGQRIYGDPWGDRFGSTLFGVGPSKGYNIFSDVKCTFKNGTYLGLGYLYRYSYFNNKKSYDEMSEYKYQYYYQTENAHSNMVRLTVGTYLKIRNKVYGNPYFALMIGRSSLHVTIDTGGATTYVNYRPMVVPLNERLTVTRFFVEIGYKFSFDIAAVLKKGRRKK